MSNAKTFPFKNARRITDAEVGKAQKAIEKATGKKRKSRGRPSKIAGEKFRAISIRLHPKILLWAKREAKKRGIGYQTVINNVLLKKSA